MLSPLPPHQPVTVIGTRVLPEDQTINRLKREILGANESLSPHQLIQKFKLEKYVNDVSPGEEFYGFSLPLIYVDKVKAYLELGLPIVGQDTWENSPFHVAIVNNRTDILKLFLQRDSSIINKQLKLTDASEDLYSPLMLLDIKKMDEAIKTAQTLVSFGANVHVKAGHNDVFDILLSKASTDDLKERRRDFKILFKILCGSSSFDSSKLSQESMKQLKAVGAIRDFRCSLCNMRPSFTSLSFRNFRSLLRLRIATSTLESRLVTLSLPSGVDMLHNLSLEQRFLLRDLSEEALDQMVNLSTEAIARVMQEVNEELEKNLQEKLSEAFRESIGQLSVHDDVEVGIRLATELQVTQGNIRQEWQSNYLSEFSSAFARKVIDVSREPSVGQPQSSNEPIVDSADDVSVASEQARQAVPQTQPGSSTRGDNLVWLRQQLNSIIGSSEVRAAEVTTSVPTTVAVEQSERFPVEEVAMALLPSVPSHLPSRSHQIGDSALSSSM